VSSLRDELLAIRAQHGVLTPAVVRDEARNVDHPLHNRFEWDDSVAGEAYRLDQAHRLIQSVRINYRAPDQTPRQVRGFHAIRTEHGYAYETVEEVGSDPMKAKLLLAEYEREWRDLRRRWEHLPDFWRVIQGDLADTA
jgi:hypothetical protein